MNLVYLQGINFCFRVSTVFRAGDILELGRAQRQHYHLCCAAGSERDYKNMLEQRSFLKLFNNRMFPVCTLISDNALMGI